MKVIADYHRCEGHGMCTLQAPDAFSLDDEGELVNHFDGVDVPEGLVADVQAAVSACPVAALREAVQPAPPFARGNADQWS